jgi:hypothetical protein
VTIRKRATLAIEASASPHPAAVVADCDESRAAALDLDTDRLGAGVERILDQLFQRRGRPLYDLARRNLAGDLLGENMDQPLRHPKPRPLKGLQNNGVFARPTQARRCRYFAMYPPSTDIAWPVT